MADVNERQRLGRLIVLRRESRGWDRKELANESGLSYPYIAQIENGDREPSLRALQAIAAALQVSVSELTDVLAEVPSRASAAPRHANPLYAGAPPPPPAPAPAAASAPMPAAELDAAFGAPAPSVEPPPARARKVSAPAASRSVVAGVLELLDELPPDRRLAALAEIQAAVLGDLVRYEVNRRTS